MASDRSHQLTGIGRLLAFCAIGLLAPLLALATPEASSALTVAVLALTVALVARLADHATVPHPAVALALARADGQASYAVRRATDPRLAPRRPRAPELG